MRKFQFIDTSTEKLYAGGGDSFLWVILIKNAYKKNWWAWLKNRQWNGVFSLAVNLSEPSIKMDLH